MTDYLMEGTEDEIRAECQEMVMGPGKFEAEQPFSFYFYNGCMEGAEGEVVYDGDTPISFFVISDDEKRLFPALAGDYGAASWESETGFWNTEILETKEDYDDAISKLGMVPDSIDEED